MASGRQGSEQGSLLRGIWPTVAARTKTRLQKALNLGRRCQLTVALAKGKEKWQIKFLKKKGSKKTQINRLPLETKSTWGSWVQGPPPLQPPCHTVLFIPPTIAVPSLPLQPWSTASALLSSLLSAWPRCVPKWRASVSMAACRPVASRAGASPVPARRVRATTMRAAKRPNPSSRALSPHRRSSQLGRLFKRCATNNTVRMCIRISGCWPKAARRGAQEDVGARRYTVRLPWFAMQGCR